MSDILTREQVEQLHVFTQPEFPEQVKYATAVRILIENDAALRQRVAELEQALRLHLAVAPDDPLLVTPVEQPLAMARAEAVKLVNDHLDHGFTTALPPDGVLKGCWHYGRCEIKALLDAIYGPPDPHKIEEHVKAK